METEVLTMHFGGESYTDLDTLSKQIDGLRHSLNTLSEKIYPDKKDVSIRVLPFEKGSFILNFVIEYAPLVTPIITTTVTLAKAYIDAVKFKQQLSGLDPISIVKTGDGKNYTVTSHDGKVETYSAESIELHSDKNAEENFNKLFKASFKSKTSGDVLIYARKRIDDQTPTMSAKIKKEELPAFTVPANISSYIADEPKILPSETWLTVGEANFLGKTKMIFLDTNGNKMVALMSDQSFINRVNESDVIFTAGMKLLVLLKTTEYYNPAKSIMEYDQEIIEVKSIHYPKKPEINTFL